MKCHNPQTYFCQVRIFLLCMLLACSSAETLKAQFILKARVVDSVYKRGLESVSIENMTTHLGATSSKGGYFELEVHEGDNIYLTYVGYKSKSIRIRAEDALKLKEITMALKPVQLKDVTIYRGPTEYQKDSMRRASIYKEAFEYEQQKSVMAPVSSLYQKFSKKYKDLRKFQSQIIDMEQQKFIDTRYTPELVQSLTKLPMDSVADFMNQYPMEIDYARAASEVEIKMWIKYNFQDYLLKKEKKK
jgi:hypothetical protein